MTQKAQQRIDSKDLKTTTLGFVEDSFFVGLGGPGRGSNKNISSRALSCSRLKKLSALTLREQFNCFYASVLHNQLHSLHKHCSSLDPSKLIQPEIVLLNGRDSQRNDRL